MYVYGSRCQEMAGYVAGKGRMDMHSLSDVDIGVKFLTGDHLSVREKVELTIEIEDLLSVGRVDLVILDEADPFFAANIIRGERLFCDNELRADEYELYILRRAGDPAPLERERLSLILDNGR